ncbi:hypothetical protein F5144DRAFT_272955 [Chaetomium tenue]|uniref:Uncharacterized protein n=1 Tax=Chaetomium tenue TaxID=1854479 RepID=A0ACB7P0S4_9PEZI|nr:hypothetical protein F5144DRAFT_272955 [Chaetomium globosum]
MPLRVGYNRDCDANFQRVYGTAFAAWAAVAANATHHGITFDQAEVLNGLHPTTSPADPDTTPHVTVRLTNATLRAQNSWYVLHWRPNGGSVVLPRADNEAANNKRRADRRAKKLRQRQRKEEEKKKKDDEGKGGGGGGASTTTTTTKKKAVGKK